LRVPLRDQDRSEKSLYGRQKGALCRRLDPVREPAILTW
jgi:hypothetical protein